MMTENKRFVKIFEDEVFYITDTHKANKTLKDFRSEIALDCLNHGGYSPGIIDEVAFEEYNEYLYENSMTGTEITDQLNTLFEENKKLTENILDYLACKYKQYIIGTPKDTVKNVAKLRLLTELYLEIKSGEYQEILSSYNSLKNLQSIPKPDLSFPRCKCIPVPVENKKETPAEVLKKTWEDIK